MRDERAGTNLGLGLGFALPVKMPRQGGMDRMTLSYLTVCSGIEAPTQAWHALGWRAVGFSEIEPFPCAVLSARWGASRPWHMPQPDDVPTHDETGQPRPPRQVDKERRARASAIKAVAHLPQQAEVPNFGDMSRFREWPDDTAFDVLAGGTPCQSFSVAGLRKGLADPRGNLMLTFGAIAGRYRPRWLVWENVPGVLSSNGGRDFGAFLGMLGELGYGVAYRVLDAQHVRTRRFPRAVPQRRRRVFVVAYLGDWRRAAAVLFDRESLSGNPPPRRQTGQEPAPTISARPSGGGGQPTAVAFSVKDHGGDALEDCSPTLRAGTHNESHQNGGVMPAVAFDMRGREGGAMPEGPHDTANIRAADGGSSRSYVAEPLAVRRLTPVECERLMGMADGYTAIPWRGKPAPDGPRYKALGNSWATTLAEWLGERIQEVDSWP